MDTENMTTQEADLRVHLQQEHKQSPLADYFKEVIYGGIDGIITTFAVVAGFSGAALASDTTTQLSFLVVLLFGLANLLADGVSMGLGNFLSVRSDQDLYQAARDKETYEVQHNMDAEYQETITILKQKGFNQTDAMTIADLYRKNQDYWVDFMMTHELEMSDPRGDNPIYTGLATFGSFLVFGSIPLIPFIVAGEASADVVFEYSVVGTFAALILLGLMKWKIVGTRLWSSLIEVVLVGGAAAVIAFMVGTFFSI